MTFSKRRPAQTRKRRKAARPGEILDAAFDAFAELGFAATGVDDIARRAGVAKGTVYVYFDSKEALFEATVRRRVVPVIEHVERFIDTFQGPTDELLRLQLETIYREVVGTQLPQLMRLLMAEGQRFPELTRFYHREVVSRGMAALARTLKRGIARGEFRALAASRHPQIVIGPALAAAMWTLLFGADHPLDLRAYARAHVDLMLRAFSGAAGKSAD